MSSCPVLFVVLFVFLSRSFYSCVNSMNFRIINFLLWFHLRWRWQDVKTCKQTNGSVDATVVVFCSEKSLNLFVINVFTRSNVVATVNRDRSERAVIQDEGEICFSSREKHFILFDPNHPGCPDLPRLTVSRKTVIVYQTSLSLFLSIQKAFFCDHNILRDCLLQIVLFYIFCNSFLGIMEWWKNPITFGVVENFSTHVGTIFFS